MPNVQPMKQKTLPALTFLNTSIVIGAKRNIKSDQARRQGLSRQVKTAAN